MAASGQQAPVIQGLVKSGATPLPGVAITVRDQAGHKIVTSSDVDGSFRVQLSAEGNWQLEAEMAGFAVATKQITMDTTHPAESIELQLTLLSRVPTPAPKPAAPPRAPQTAARGTPGSRLQHLNAVGDELATAASTASSPDTPLPGMPSLGTSSDAANESLAITGATGSNTEFTRNLDELRDRAEELQNRGPQSSDNMGQPGGPGGLGGMPGGGGMLGGGGRGGAMGRFAVNKIHGSLAYNLGDSALNAEPYSLTGTPTAQPGYASNRLNGTIGGPLNIPHVYQGGMKTFFFVNFNVTRSSNLYDQFSNVPTRAERGGDFSQTLVNGQPVQIFNPASGQPFTGNVPVTSQAQALLNFIPLPNQPLGAGKNYRFTSATGNHQENIGFRLIHNFGPAQSGRRGSGFRSRNNLNFALTYSGSAGDLARPFPTLGGKTDSHGERAQMGYSVNRGRWTNQLNFNFNQQQTGTRNFFAGTENVAALAGITGVSSNPADWGVPGLSFSDYSGLRGVIPQNRRDQVYQTSDTLIWRHGKHNVRFGSDLRRMFTDLRRNSNPDGSFTFTGFATAQYVNGKALPGTGYDFADFLLGLPQQTAVQYSPYAYNFRALGYDLFTQDSWRVRSNLSMELGLRYEYVSPYSEEHNRIANLEPATGFVSVTPVVPGTVGSYFFLPGLVKPDRDNFAPRVGIAWKPRKKTVVRAGYGINYNVGQYKSIVQQLAFQPPFSITQSPIASLPGALSLANGFPTQGAGTITNNYGVDPNYRLGYVQMWNLNVQYELSPTLLLNVGYTGSKGTALDMVRAPNRGPAGLLIANAQSFLWETSQGDSILHAGSVRMRKRMAKGLSIGGTYTFAKSIDNASSIGGGAVVVAQNDQNLAAERGLSSFDVRHRVTGDWVYELPVGTGKRWLDRGGVITHLLGDWSWSGDFTLQSGSPFTAQVVGNITDVSRGSNGSLRADYNGAPITLSNPTIQQWFNTAAFSLPAPGQFGTSGRNTIIGPGQVNFDMSMNKNIPIRDMMGMEIRLSANNVFNTPHFTAIDANLNSRTFGEVTSVGSMRALTAQARFRF